MGKTVTNEDVEVTNGEGTGPLHSNLLEEDIPTERPNDVSFFQSVRDHFRLQNPLSVEKPSNGRGSTIFLILNTMIGSGILNQAQVFKEAGIISTLIMYAVATYAIWFGLQLLIEVGLAKRSYGFTEVASLAFGRKGELSVDLLIVVGNFGALMSYMVVVAGELADILVSITGLHSWYFEEVFLLPLVTIFFVLPTCLQRYYGHFVLISIFSIFAITCVMMTVIFCGPIEGAANSSDSLNYFELEGTLTEFGSTMFALSCAYAAFHAFSSMKKTTEEAWVQATVPAVIIGALMCIATGLMGYLSFRDSTSGDILDNFTSTGYEAVKALVIIHLLLYIPLDFVVMRHSFCKIIQKDLETMHVVPYILLTVVLLAITCFCVVLLFACGVAEGDAFGYILDFTGGITSPALSFIFPGALYIKLMPRDATRW
eukprot:CAMPEP_0117756670 /NCGR_PEP_ID=MMETSP0947-20121206/14229_1 /TAXON_ID=44440 /ORGANISM="Chattonella subsalsa, Strain CCMP2191" /LENGTH=427 /DNA_ID=CAMNT_0005576327 /DNA_START=79 /DNA_END=1359 /DNA_ORIENTATION=-